MDHTSKKLRLMRRAVLIQLVSSLLLTGCSGGGAGGGAPIVPAATPTPMPTGAAPAPSGTPTSSATTLPGVTPTPRATLGPVASATPTSSISQRSYRFKLFIPPSGITRTTTAAQRVGQDTSLPTFVSSATQSIGITVGTDPQQIISVGGTAPGCTTTAGLRSCDIVIPLPAAGFPALKLALYASADGSGSPISATTFTTPAASAAPQSDAISFKPVIANLQATLGAQFAAGDAAETPITVVARTNTNDALDLLKENPVDKDGNPVTIYLSNSDTSGKTTLAGNTYGGSPDVLRYNGDLPLPVAKITITAKSGSTTLATTTVANQLPTASHAYTFTTSAVNQILNTFGFAPADWQYIPDGKFNAIKMSDSSYWFTWGNDMRTTGSGPLPENQSANLKKVFPHTQPWEQIGGWMLSVYQQNTPYTNTDSKNLIALYHAESNYTGYYDKTMAVTYSHDGGETWAVGQQIITPVGYPTVAASQHAGDSCVVWDPFKKRWVAFYAGDSITIAQSYDRNGAPGTWKKFYQGSYTEPGLGGKETPNPSFQSRYFSSPSVSWNSYLNKWVMTMDGHPGIWLATSDDLDTWTVPQVITDGKEDGPNDDAAYSSFIGVTGDKVTQRASRLYYAEFPANQPKRLYGRTLTFTRSD